MALHHDAENSRVSGGDLRRDIAPHRNLFVGIFTAVAVAAVDHNARRNPGFSKTLGGSVDVGGVVIGLLAAAQNNVAIVIAGRRYDRRKAILGYRSKMT